MSETQSQRTKHTPSKDGTSQITRSSHARTAKIRRTREVIERVEVEHVAEDGEPPVTTTAEQRVFKSTNMERGKQISDGAPQDDFTLCRQLVKAPGRGAQDTSGHTYRGAIAQEAMLMQEQITSQRQPGRAAKKGSQTQVDIPIQAADTSDAAPAFEIQQEVPHHMSTQEYMEEAEELLTHPMPKTQPEDAAPEDTVAAEEEIAAGNLAEQTSEDAAAAGEHLAEHIQPAAGDKAAAPEEQPSADAGADAAAPPAGEAGLVGRVAQVGRRIVRSLLHPDDAGTAAMGEGAAHLEGEPLEEGRQPEQPAADTEQVYHVEEPEQSSEEAEAPAEPLQKAPKGREATKETAKRSATQAADAGAEATEEAAKGAGAKKGRGGAVKQKPYTPAKAAMRGSPDEAQPVEEVLTQHEEAAPAPRTPNAKRGRPAAPRTPPKTKGHANPAKELLEVEEELEAPPATAEETAAPSKRGRGQPSKAATKSSPPAKRSRAETSDQAAQGGKSKKAQKTSPKSPPSGQARQGRAGPSKAPDITPAAPAKAPRRAPPAKTPAAASKKAPAKGPSKVPRARAAGVQKRPARQPGSRRKERPESFKIYLYRVLKEIHPDIALSMKAISVLDNFTKDMHDKIANEAADLCRRHNRATLSSREIDAAVRFLLPGELFNHAVSEGRKAVARALSTSE